MLSSLCTLLFSCLLWNIILQRWASKQPRQYTGLFNWQFEWCDPEIYGWSDAFLDVCFPWFWEIYTHATFMFHGWMSHRQWENNTLSADIIVSASPGAYSVTLEDLIKATHEPLHQNVSCFQMWPRIRSHILFATSNYNTCLQGCNCLSTRQCHVYFVN